jgi:hypothetical protein
MESAFVFRIAVNPSLEAAKEGALAGLPRHSERREIVVGSRIPGFAHARTTPWKARN